MDIVQELTINVEYLQSLQICDNIALLQWFIDEDMVECDTRNTPRYFGKKWTKTGRCIKSYGQKRQYVYNKKVRSWEFIDIDTVSEMGVVDGVKYFSVNGKIHQVSFEDINILINDNYLISVNIKGIFRYESMLVKNISIYEEDTININIPAKKRSFFKDGIEYFIPWAVTTINPNIIISGDNEFDKIDHNVFWTHRFEVRTIAGHLIKYPDMEFATYKAEYVDAPFNHEYNVKNLIDKQIFAEIKKILPPITLESVLYTPQIYTSCMKSIDDVVRPFINSLNNI